MNGQTPQEKALHLLAEQASIYMLPRLVAVEDFRLSQAAHRRRTHDANKAGMAQLGHEVSPMLEDEELGDITVANHYHIPPSSNGQATVAAQPQSATEQGYTKEQVATLVQQVTAEAADAAYQRLKAKLKAQQEAKQGSAATAATILPAVLEKARWYMDWKNWALGAALLFGGGATGVAVTQSNSSSEPAAPVADTDTDTNMQYKFDISSETGKGIATE